MDEERTLPKMTQPVALFVDVRSDLYELCAASLGALQPVRTPQSRALDRLTEHWPLVVVLGSPLPDRDLQTMREVMHDIAAELIVVGDDADPITLRDQVLAAAFRMEKARKFKAR